MSKMQRDIGMRWLVRRLASWFIRKYWGPRCASVYPGCGCCDAWLMYDYLFTANWHEGATRTVQLTIYVPESTNWDTPSEPPHV